MFDPKAEARRIAGKLDEAIGGPTPESEVIIETFAAVVELELMRLIPSPCNGLSDK